MPSGTTAPTYALAAASEKKLPPYLKSFAHAATINLVSLAQVAELYCKLGYVAFKKPIVSSTI